MTPIKLRTLSACIALQLLVLALLMMPLPLHAEIAWLQLRLSAPMPSFANVWNYLVTPDGNYVLYTADQYQDNHLNLFRVPTGGGPVVQLDLLPAENQRVTSSDTQEELSPSIICCEPIIPPTGTTLTAISPDSQRVLFALYGNQYSVAVAGGTAVKLVGPLGNGNFPAGVLISPDSRYALFNGRESIASPEKIVSVPIAGGPTSEIGVQPFGDLVRMGITPDSQKVLFWAGTTSVQLYTVPITGGTPLMLNAPLVTDGTVDWYGNLNVTSDSRTMVYRADQESDEVWELYSVAIEGGPTTKLNAPLVQNGDTTFFKVTPDGQRIVYLADQTIDEEWDLYTVPISGGLPVALTQLIAETVKDYATFEITPDSRRVVFDALSITSGSRVALYSVAIEGGTPIALNPPLPAGGFIDSWLLSPNGERVAYILRSEGSDHVDLFVASVSDGARIQINLSAANHTVERPQFTHDSKYLIFLSFTGPGGFSLYRASASDGNVVRLDSALHKMSATQFDFAPVAGRSTVIYGSNEPLANQLELLRTFEVDFTDRVVLPQAKK